MRVEKLKFCVYLPTFVFFLCFLFFLSFFQAMCMCCIKRNVNKTQGDRTVGHFYILYAFLIENILKRKAAIFLEWFLGVPLAPQGKRME